MYANNTGSGVIFISSQSFGTSFVRLRVADWESLKSINLYRCTKFSTYEMVGPVLDCLNHDASIIILYENKFRGRKTRRSRIRDWINDFVFSPVYLRDAFSQKQIQIKDLYSYSSSQ